MRRGLFEVAALDGAIDIAAPAEEIFDVIVDVCPSHDESPNAPSADDHSRAYRRSRVSSWCPCSPPTNMPDLPVLTAGVHTACEGLITRAPLSLLPPEQFAEHQESE
jgi:hypothetical protein